jgi:hypothetical protein
MPHLFATALARRRAAPLSATLLKRAAAGCALGIAALTATAQQPLPPYSASRQVLLNLLPPVSRSDFGSLRLEDPRFGAVAEASSGTPFPLLTAMSDITGSPEVGNLFGRGSSILNYRFEVVGPQAMVPVLVNVHGAAAGTSSGGGTIAVEAFWSISGDIGDPLAGDDLRSGQVAGFDGAFDRSFELLLQANFPYTVSMLADAAAGASGLGSHAQASAFVDPVFALGSGVDPALYALQFSAGIGNAAAVPEPTSLALLAAGLFTLAVVGVGRSRPARAARSSPGSGHASDSAAWLGSAPARC